MRKRHIAAAVALTSTAFLVKKHFEPEFAIYKDPSGLFIKSNRKRKNTKLLILTGENISSTWNPLEVLKDSEKKVASAKRFARIILNTTYDEKAEDIAIHLVETDLLATILLYADQSENNTLMFVYEVIAEMASLGNKFKFEKLPEIYSSRPISFCSLNSAGKQIVVEDLLAKIEKLEIEKYSDVLQDGDIHLKEFFEGKYDISVIDKNKRSLISILLEEMISIGAAAWR